MTTKWWLTRAGDCLRVDEGEMFLDCVAKHPAFFGTTTKDVEFAMSKGEDGQLALLDQLCWDVTDDITGEVKQLGAIFIERTAVGLEICIWQESYQAYERIMAWLANHEFLANTNVIMKEGGSQRGWRTTVGMLLTQPFAKNPDRRGNCPTCGEQMSWDEIVERRVCPKCMEKLA